MKIITDLATKDADTFLEFMMANESSEFLIVHRLLSRGLEALAFQNAQAGLEYLAGDPRRLILGDLHDSQVETKRLIRAVSSRLNDEGKQKLEHIVLAYSKYKRVLPEWSAKEKLQRRRWDRRARLDLLRAIPVESLSANTRKIRSEEELVFPETRLPFEDTRSSSGWVGPRMTAKEMGHASDDDLLRLFNELPDSVGWDNPKRTWSQDMSRAGGAIQLSRELSELAKQAPDRVLSLISHLQPQVHEQYAGEAVKGLIGTDLPTEALLRIMEDLDNRGFHSTEFRDDIASAAEGLANRNNGLPEEFLRRLQAWLADEPKPIWPEPSDSRLQQHDSEKSGSILYESGGFSTLTHARGSITRAIADGYLKRNPPDVKEWSRFVESRLTNEKHPQIWAEILTRMVILFQGDRRRATILFDQAIKACPDVFHYPLTLHAIARVLRGIEPKDIGESWLESLLADGSSFCQQAYGELLPLFNCFHQDSGSMDRLATYLQGENRIAEIDRGLAYAATYIWTSQRCRDVARLILCTLASSNDKTVHSAVACLFRLTRDNFELDDDMRRIIYKAASNPPLLLLSSQDLVETLEPLTGTEPKLVAHVCEQILRFGSEEITQPGSSWIYVASGLTNIALTLHRQTAYRETGLKLFEELIALNVREAKDAIELLDRRPIIGTDNSRRRRWRRRPRRVRRTAGL